MGEAFTNGPTLGEMTVQISSNEISTDNEAVGSTERTCAEGLSSLSQFFSTNQNEKGHSTGSSEHSVMPVLTGIQSCGLALVISSR